MVPRRREQPGELEGLRRLNAALAALYPTRPAGGSALTRYNRQRARLLDQRRDEVTRLRSPEGGGWTLGELAAVLGTKRATVQLWANPDRDRRRPPLSGTPHTAWVVTLAVGGWAGRHVVCQLCHAAVVRLLAG